MPFDALSEVKNRISPYGLFDAAYGCGTITAFVAGIVVATLVAIERGRGWAAVMAGSLTITAIFLGSWWAIGWAIKAYVVHVRHTVEAQLFKGQLANRGALNTAIGRIGRLREMVGGSALAELDETIRRLEEYRR